jgi:hypothetical protein
MKTFPSRLLIVAIAAVTASPVLAQAVIRLGQRPIARTEVIAFVKKQFAQMDANHDRHISYAEFEDYRIRQGERSETGIGHIGRRWFQKADTDRDGIVTLAEAVAVPLRMFDMADVNRDGVASVKEQSLAQMLKGS